MNTFINQYEQNKRWAWGVSDIPYVIRQAVLTKDIPFVSKFSKISNLLEHHILWPVNWFLITIGSAVPPLINPQFGRTVLGHNLSTISSGILTLSTIFGHCLYHRLAHQTATTKRISEMENSAPVCTVDHATTDFILSLSSPRLRRTHKTYAWQTPRISCD